MPTDQLKDQSPESVAMSLINYHRRVFQQMTEADVEAMLQGEPNELARQYKNSPNITAYVIDSILNEKTATERIARIVFWMDVLEKCDEYHDHTSVDGIKGGIQNCIENLWYSKSKIDETHQIKFQALLKRKSLDADVNVRGEEKLEHPLLPNSAFYTDRASKLKDIISNLKECTKEIEECRKKIKKCEDNDEPSTAFKEEATLLGDKHTRMLLEKQAPETLLNAFKLDHQKVRSLTMTPQVDVVSEIHAYTRNTTVPYEDTCRKLEPRAVCQFKEFLEKRIQYEKKPQVQSTLLIGAYEAIHTNILNKLDTIQNQEILDLQKSAQQLYLFSLDTKIVNLEGEKLQTSFVKDLKKLYKKHQSICKKDLAKGDMDKYVEHVREFQTALDKIVPPKVGLDPSKPFENQKGAYDRYLTNVRQCSNISDLKAEVKNQIEIMQGLQQTAQTQKNADIRQRQLELKAGMSEGRPPDEPLTIHYSGK